MTSPSSANSVAKVTLEFCLWLHRNFDRIVAEARSDELKAKAVAALQAYRFVR